MYTHKTKKRTNQNFPIEMLKEVWLKVVILKSWDAIGVTRLYTFSLTVSSQLPLR
jgi:hypothetical protein